MMIMQKQTNQFVCEKCGVSFRVETKLNAHLLFEHHILRSSCSTMIDYNNYQKRNVLRMKLAYLKSKMYGTVCWNRSLYKEAYNIYDQLEESGDKNLPQFPFHKHPDIEKIWLKELP